MGLTKLDIHQFYEYFFNQHDITAADKIIAEDYIQHNPGVPQGREALKVAFQKRFLTGEFFQLAIDRILVDEDYIAVFLRNIDEQGETKFSVIDLYRVEADQFVEHWDYFDYKNVDRKTKS